MAYGKKYIIKFKNRLQNDIYRCEIWQKDFVGSVTQLTGADSPFTIAWNGSDTDILNPIKAFEITLSINTSTLTINDFYSDDDEEFRTDFYFESLANGTGTAKLLYSGYLIEDGVSEPVTDRLHVLTLKATDNLGLLKNIKWNEIEISVDYNAKLSLIYFIQYCLKATGLYSPDTTIDMSLPLRVYDNLFENTTDDRTVSDESDPWQSIVLHSNIFQNSDGTWQDLYSVLSTVLKNKNAFIIQADGAWNVIRVAEYSLFTNGAIPGTEYFDPVTINAVTLNEAVSIDRNGIDLVPVLEDQTNSIQRPFKIVKNTFNYNQASSLIKQNTLQLPAGATPYSTSTVSGIRYDKYDLATYFPEWLQIDTDASYLQVETDTTLTPETENDRYIVTPSNSSVTSGVRLNPIEVSKGDIFDFTVRMRTATDGGNIHFVTRITLLTTANTYFWCVAAVDTLANAHWASTGPTGQAITNYYTTESQFGVNTLGVSSGDDSSKWVDYSIAFSQNQAPQVILIPLDGILLIEVMGAGGTRDDNPVDAYWKDCALTFYNFINNSVKIIGQTHLETGTSTIKAIQENDTQIDDSPRNSIGGTLFRNDITTFGLSVGDIFFTKTTLWHRANISEALRLGNILTQERLRLNYTTRLIREGSFKNLRYDTDKFISLLSLFTLGDVSGKYLAAASLTLDYMNCIGSGKLLEIYKDDEDDFTEVYSFNYLYKIN
jgi:hypothetical protein